MNREPIYYYQPEKGIVVCELSECELDAISFMTKHFTPMKSTICGGLGGEDCGLCNKAIDTLEDMPENFFMHGSYKGVAVTKDGDTYDAEFGKKLAYSIAMKKHNIALAKKVRNIAADYRKYTLEMTTSLVKSIEKADKRVERSEEVLAETLKEVK